MASLTNNIKTDLQKFNPSTFHSYVFVMCCHLHGFNSFALEPLLVVHSKLKVLFTSMVGENIPATDGITDFVKI